MNRILVVDDHEIVRRGLRDLLAGDLGPVGIVEAGSAADAVARLTTESWDLVLLDINLPGRDGFEVLDESKRLQPTTPVIMLTSYPEEQFAVRAFRHGASAYVAKHEAAELLVAAIRRVLAGGRFVTPALAERLAASMGIADVPPHELLSSRELQVLRLVAQGRTQREIAAALSLSEKTIATYRARIADKTGLTSGVEITRYAMQHHLADWRLSVEHPTADRGSHPIASVALPAYCGCMNAGNPSTTTLVVLADTPLVADRLIELAGEVPGLAVIGTSTSGDEGPALVGRLQPDVVIVDLQIRHSGGFDLVRRVRATSATAVLLVLAAWSFPGLLVRCRASGADDVFTLLSDLDRLVLCLTTYAAAREGGVHDSPVSS